MRPAPLLSRLFVSIVGVALLAAGCSGASEGALAERSEPSTQAAPAQTEPATTGESPVDAETAPASNGDRGEDNDAPTEGAEPIETDALRLLPDPDRWVVVQDWSERVPADEMDGEMEGLQLDVAPLNGAGIPQLGRRISLRYETGPIEDFDSFWGDASSMGEPVDFEADSGVGRSVSNPDLGFAMTVVWIDGTYVTAQAQHGDTDLRELARSLREVDSSTWTAARAGAEDQRLLAVEAAMVDVEPGAPADAAMPHWVLPEPWELEWVTDKTIWTEEEWAQSEALARANRPPQADVGEVDVRTWDYSYGRDANEAARRFFPQITITTRVFDGDLPMPSVSDEQISALGLSGVITSEGAGTRVELGTGPVRILMRTASGLDEEVARQFLAQLEFAGDDPLDGFVIDDPRFIEVDLDREASIDRVRETPRWHASWTRPTGFRAVISVWRMSVPEVRRELQVRAPDLEVPDDVWESIEAQEVIDFGAGTTYDASTGILMSLDGVRADDLIPIELDEWISLVEPVNADPLNPR